MVIMYIKFQLLIAFNGSAKVASRRAIDVISCKAFPLQILHRHHRTLHILVLPGTGSTDRVLVCLSVREHWSSHWLLTLELCYCIETYLCIAQVSCTHVYICTVYVAIALTCTRVGMSVHSPSQEGGWAKTL
jgi:hypothetical protein